MADESRSAEVQLTADISGYTQPVAQATRQTNVLTESVNKLAASLDGITKRAGKKLIIFGAADAAAMTAYTAAAAKYEKQLTTLRAQTEISGKSIEKYKKGIEDIARQMPITGAAVVELVTQINKLGVTSERQATQMARTFTQLAAATGEDIGALTQGLIELSRQMGTLGNGAQGISNFSDSLTSVSNSAGVSATAVLSFAQAIAPMSRAAGIGQKEVLGISTAFTKAGADGFAAANTFNSMVTDITRQVMSGSPEIAKYAAAVGATVEQFKQMDSTERIVQIFEAVTKAGPDAVKLIDRLGYDGIRAAKSIQAVANESGGLRKAIQDSIGAYGNGSTQKGAEAAFSSMDAAMTRFRNNLEQIAATIGSSLLPVATAFMNVLNKGLEAVNQMAGPLLQVAGAIGGILAPLSMAFGGLMTMMGPLSSLMMAMTLFRLSPIRGMIQGIKEGAAAKSLATYSPGSTPIPFTQAGKHNAAGELKAYQRGPFRLGERIGGMLPVGTPGVPSSLGQMLLRGGIGATGMVNTWYIDPTKTLYNNASMRDPFLRQSITGDQLDRAWNARGRLGATLSQAFTNPYAFMAGRGGPLTNPPAMAGGGVKTMSEMSKVEAEARAEKIYREKRALVDERTARNWAAAEYKNTMKAYSDEAEKAAKATSGVTKANIAQVKTLGDFRSALIRTGVNAAGIPIAAGRMAGGLALQGIGRVGGGLLTTLGGMVGGGAGTGAAILGAAAVGYGVYKTREGTTNNIINDETQTNISRVNTALGLTAKTLGEFNKSVRDSSKATENLATAADGFRMARDKASTLSAAYSDDRISRLGSTSSAQAFLKTMGPLNGQQARALTEDFVRRFGYQNGMYVGQAYSNRGYNPYTQGYGEIAKPLFTEAARYSDAGLVGRMRNFGLDGLVGVDSTTTEQVQAAWMGSREQAGLIAERYGNKAATAKQIANEAALLSGAFGLGSSAGDRRVQSQNVKQWEALYGELGLTEGANGLTSSFMGGQSLNTMGDFYSYVMDKSNTSEGAKRFREAAQTAGLSLKDITGGNADSIAIRLQRGNLSDFERNVRSTALGNFARGSSGVKAVTEGAQVEDPKAVGQAINDMYDKLTRSGSSFDNVTAQANRLADAVGSTADPLYQLAMAAKQLAFSRGLTQATNEGGMVGSYRFRLNQNAQEIRNMQPGSDLQQSRSDRDQIKNEALADAKAYENALYQYGKSTARAQEDFNTQMLYQEQDFAKSLRRAAEDAAKSIYDPFQRVFNPGTSGSDTIITNLKDQNAKIAEQMANLKKLKEMGLSQQSIDTLQLTDPKMWAQVERLASEGGAGINQINAEVGKRGKLAKEATQNPMVQSYRRIIEDFEQSRTRANDSFQRSLKRSAEDMKDYGREILGNMDSVMTQIQTRLDEVMPGVDSPFYKKLLEVAAMIEKPQDEPKPAKSGSGSGSSAVGGENGAYTPPRHFTDPMSVSGQTQVGFSDAQMATPAGWKNAWFMTGTNRWYANTKGTHKGSPLLLPEVWASWEAQSDHGAMSDWWSRNVVQAGLATGGFVKGPITANLGERGKPELVFPLDAPEGKAAIAHLAVQITDVMVKGLNTARYSTPAVYRGGSTHIVNNNNHFRVEKVVADNPMAMAKALKAEQKRKNIRLGAYS